MHTSTSSQSGFSLRLRGDDARKGTPDVPGVLLDGTVTRELADSCNVSHSHAQPLPAVLCHVIEGVDHVTEDVDHVTEEAERD